VDCIIGTSLFFSFIKLRALQGQKRALLALQKRSEQRLIEQQELTSKKNTNLKQTNEENDLLSDINNLRNRYEKNFFFPSNQFIKNI
jgi:hypothetical protein